MEDHIAAVNLVNLQPYRWCTADSGSKTECKEANKGRDQEDDADQPHLLSPGTALSLLRHAKAPEHEVGGPESDDRTICVP